MAAELKVEIPAEIDEGIVEAQEAGPADVVTAGRWDRDKEKTRKTLGLLVGAATRLVLEL